MPRYCLYNLPPISMTSPGASEQPAKIPPPSKSHLSLMIWLSVFPTLTAINLALGDWLGTLSPVVRTFVLATIAVPIVMDEGTAWRVRQAAMLTALHTTSIGHVDFARRSRDDRHSCYQRGRGTP